mgnify:CR=1 FL=1
MGYSAPMSTLDDVRLDMRDLADAMRDLAEAMRLMASQIEGRLEATEKAVDELRRARAGAPYWLVAALLSALVSQAAVVLWLYGDSRGQDASEAFRVAGDAVSGLPSPEDAGTPTTGSEPP